MTRSILACFCALFLSGACAAEQPPEPVPFLELTGRVIDAAEVLEPEYEAALTQSLAQLETDTLVQLVVVTTPDLLGYDISDYSRMLGNAWGIGDAERNDGLLIVVAPNERKVRIQIGLGLESTVTDEEARKIIETGILPAFGRGDYSAGISEGVERLLVEVSQPELREAA